MTISTVELLHKIEQYNASASAANQIIVHAVIHTQSQKNSIATPDVLSMLYEALHLLGAKLETGNQKRIAKTFCNRLLFERHVYNQKIDSDVIPAKSVRTVIPNTPAIKIEACEAIWRNPLDYVTNGKSYTLGRFLIKTKLKAGRHSGTYQGRDQQLERSVILKALSPRMSLKLSQYPEQRNKTLEIIRQLARIEIPGLAAIYDMGFIDEVFFYVREHMEGRSLADIIKSKRHLKPAECIALGLKMCKALNHTHSRKIYHCNLKPTNVWLLQSGEISIVDFYVPGFIETLDETKTLTQNSWHYAAPEWLYNKKYSHQCDIYSIGMILYELLAGKHPFKRVHYLTNYDQFTHLNIPSLSILKSELLPLCTKMIDTAIERDPKNRFENLNKLEAALNSVLKILAAGHSDESPPLTLTTMR